jgi:tetratricopeptide (TPR) repeat protein
MSKVSARTAASALLAWGLIVLTLPASPVRGEDPGDDAAGRAVALYDAGRYAEARAIFETLDARGDLDGPLLYRLSLATGATGDSRGQQEVLQRAIATLEEEVDGAPSLEPAFYLANALRNANRKAEAREVAVAATGRIDSGAWTPPDDPLEAFRAGKLYADLGKQTDATRWYRRALEGFDAEPGAQPVYSRWARNYLASLAFSRGEFEAAEGEYAALTATEEAQQADWDRLAVVRVRLKRWTAAEEAWRQAEKANPGEGDRARYSWRLAAAAAELAPLPEAAPDGRPFGDLGQGELEALMQAQAGRVQEIMARAAADDVTEDERAALADELVAIKPVFVAAGLEYSARSLPIREAAFFGGYAPLIFHESRWHLPEPTPAAEVGP